MNSCTITASHTTAIKAIFPVCFILIPLFYSCASLYTHAAYGFSMDGFEQFIQLWCLIIVYNAKGRTTYACSSAFSSSIVIVPASGEPMPASMLTPPDPYLRLYQITVALPVSVLLSPDSHQSPPAILPLPPES